MAAAVTIAYTLLPSARASSTPVTVTVCGVFQLAAVNVNDEGDTVPSVPSVDESPIETLDETEMMHIRAAIERMREQVLTIADELQQLEERLDSYQSYQD